MAMQWLTNMQETIDFLICGLPSLALRLFTIYQNGLFQKGWNLRFEALTSYYSIDCSESTLKLPGNLKLTHNGPFWHHTTGASARLPPATLGHTCWIKISEVSYGLVGIGKQKLRSQMCSWKLDSLHGWKVKSNPVATYSVIRNIK
jgi:hypothetical protein